MSQAGTPALLRRQGALDFEPGTSRAYSNSGYLLLSPIGTRTSGRSLREFAAESILAPLAMSSAQCATSTVLMMW